MKCDGGFILGNGFVTGMVSMGIGRIITGVRKRGRCHGKFADRECVVKDILDGVEVGFVRNVGRAASGDKGVDLELG